MIPGLPDPFVSHTEPEALIPNRILRQEIVIPHAWVERAARPRWWERLALGFKRSQYARDGDCEVRFKWWRGQLYVMGIRHGC